MKNYDDYLIEVRMLIDAGHNRSDIIKALKIEYLMNEGDKNPIDELGKLISDIEGSRHELLFK
ncbi:hypothetical protein [Alteromonas lipolytica]|uniref:Uncharacterized protein n=1 Tax=Alteromonas lipolytica TaxID=1856405 RepID=A0A1E8FEK0_9ALTE|nr:hypothetical protein [Alteromonas lipolytica]OFI34186.1 hypothetical protein BFC17_21860 [Alteromonas lipolytica]GGF84306.1 hypothetical protein GCM10011338_40770 [Alteromonas lipolytica]